MSCIASLGTRMSTSFVYSVELCAVLAELPTRINLILEFRLHKSDSGLKSFIRALRRVDGMGFGCGMLKEQEDGEEQDDRKVCN